MVRGGRHHVKRIEKRWIFALGIVAVLVSGVVFGQEPATQSLNNIDWTQAQPPATQPPPTQPPAQPPTTQPPTQPPPAQPPTGTQPPTATQPAAAPTLADAAGASALLDRMETVLSAELGETSGGAKAVGTSGVVPGVDKKSKAGKVSVDRAALDEVLAEVQQLKAMLRVKQ
jgi:cytoskeletal protein RodZ